MCVGGDCGDRFLGERGGGERERERERERGGGGDCGDRFRIPGEADVGSGRRVVCFI